MNIFPVSSVYKTIPGAPIVAASPLFPYVPIPEVGANHWLLGVNADSLIAFGGSATLTAQSTGHSFGDNFVTVPSFGNALVTNIADAVTQSMYAVFRYQPVSAKTSLIVGNISAASVGAGVWLEGNGDIRTVLRSGATPVSINHGVPSGVMSGDWLFVGLSKRVVEGNSKTITQIGSVQFNGGTWVGTQALGGTSPLAIGNAYANTATYTPTPTDFAELIVKSTTNDTSEQMMQIYLRSKKRMASRGIVLK
jgi:hypothetical protein